MDINTNSRLSSRLHTASRLSSRLHTASRLSYPELVS